MASEEKKLFLLDAFALIYRGYFALSNSKNFNPYNSKGQNISAILGFTNTLIDVLNNQKPSHIGVVFDPPSDTIHRNEDYAEYKANREAMPDDIRSALPYIHQIIEAFNIPTMQVSGYEADDVIGTLAKKAEKAGFITYMMTPDKDFGQLVSENIYMFKPPRFGNSAEVWGVKEVCEKFEIQRPEQVIDILGLWGDAVDNIPGVPGVGEKTAKKLIGDYGSIEGLYEHTHELKGKLKEKVEANHEQALMSKKLATIITDVPIELDIEGLKMASPNKEKVIGLFSELEFRTLAKRVFNEEIKASGQSGQTSLFGETTAEETTEEAETVEEFKTIATVKHSYQLVETREKRTALVKSLQQAASVCFDTETTGLDPQRAELVGMSFSITPHEAYYVNVPNDDQTAREIVQEFKTILEDENKELIGQNIKYDLIVLERYGVQLKAKLFDTMIAHYLIQPDMRHNMDVLSENYLNYRPVSIETLIGKKGKNQLSMRDAPIKQLSEYAAEDADITLQLKQLFQPQIEEAYLKKLFYEIEMPLVRVLADMEVEGINLDVDNLKAFSTALTADIKSLEDNITELAGTAFNLDSPKQLGQILYEVLNIVAKPKKTKTGQYATSEDVLTQLSHAHEIVPKILDYRSLRKLKTTYVDTLPEDVNPATQRIHTNYSQTIAATGRLSSNNPNLQNIPIRTPRGREIRRAFIPRNADYQLLAADYSQIELRIIAALSEDEDMQKAFINNEDIHTTTAANVFGVPFEEVSREMRGKAKSVNFGIIYGVSAFGLAQNLNIPRSEAKDIIETYFSKYPKVKAYMDNNIEYARKNGYVETIMGRRRYLKDINAANAAVRGHAERNAINAPIQGSAADVIKVAMINIHKEMKQLKCQSKMLLQVHDELVFDLHNNEREELMPMIKDKMENAVKMKVPLLVEMETAANWLEAH
jgi:DNA polymerase-1